MTVTNERNRFEPERDDKQQRGFTHALSWLAIKHRAMRRSLLLAFTVLVPFSMGVRECERVPVGENCAADGGVCSCDYDGKTYAAGDSFKSADGCNECSCADDGQVACTLKACLPNAATCGGIAGLKCPGAQFCDYAIEATCGAADRTGTCRDKPQVCDFALIPVCGCDGKTYDNPCQAASAGISIASKGACTSTPPSGDVCEYNGKRYKVGESFPSIDGCNTCTCAENGNTNTCTEKACPPAPAACGSRGLAECPDGQYCKWEPKAICGRADAPGVCTVIPQACTREFKPVCGCDNNTYSTECVAASSGISVLTQGECGTGCDYEGTHYAVGDAFPASDGCNKCSCTESGVACTLIGCAPSGKTCGGLIGAQCAKGEFCNFPLDAICGAADATGVCEAIPQVCTDQYDPVCGCNDKTYGNSCEANAAGTSVSKKGECTAAPGCDVGGVHYEVGANYMSPDGCNTCTCGANGTSGCTKKACVPKTCGGIAALKCDAGQYCSYELEAKCGYADASGVCKPLGGPICTTIYAPVCGCDGTTYSSDCQAASKGVAIKSKGECP